MRLLAHAEPSHPSALFVLLVQESAQQYFSAGSQITAILRECGQTTYVYMLYSRWILRMRNRL
jgi:hypothetical protein